jgi:GDPmannose 4,6-dehydratase
LIVGMAANDTATWGSQRHDLCYVVVCYVVVARAATNALDSFVVVARRALITGITGQDGSYLAELLLDKGYEVHGVVRRSSTMNRGRIDHLQHAHPTHSEGSRFVLHYGDMTDSGGLNRLVKTVRPDELYNLAAQSHVQISFDQPEYTGDTDGVGTTRLLEAVRTLGLPVRFYQASTSEMFGLSAPPQNETTAFMPRSPYAIAKLYAHWMTINYREAHDLFACSGILFNHESPRRGENFVTRKVTRGVAQILAGKSDKLRMGNLEAKRDWGHARDYVRAMWLMLQQEEPDDYVIATGTTRSVKEFVEAAFGLVGLDWQKYVQIDDAYMRPADVPVLRGDSSKAAEKLGWTPTVTFEELVREMLENDLQLEGVDPAKHLRQPPARVGP